MDEVTRIRGRIEASLVSQREARDKVIGNDLWYERNGKVLGLEIALRIVDKESDGA